MPKISNRDAENIWQNQYISMLKWIKKTPHKLQTVEGIINSLEMAHIILCEPALEASCAGGVGDIKAGKGKTCSLGWQM